MKRLSLTLLLLAVALPVAAHNSHRIAQPHSLQRHEIRIMAGAYPLVPDIVLLLEELMEQSIEQQFGMTKKYRGPTFTTGTYTVSYAYRFRKWISFGLGVSYSNDYYNTYNNLDGSVLKRHNIGSISAIPTVRFTWLNRPLVRLYSSFGMGITFVTGNHNNTSFRQIFAGQLTPIGIAVGRSLFGFIEVGLGTQGALMAGIGYSFNSKKAMQ